MRILYAIQGTGNGHLARATEMIPKLRKYGRVDILVSGIQGDIQLPFYVKYKFYGLSFIFGKKGGIDYWRTLLKAKPFGLVRDIFHLPVEDYDLILNDFEPVSAWACLLKGRSCVAVSHQGAVLHPLAPQPSQSNFFARMILKYYAPATVSYGFHFKALDFYHFTPVIRSSIRKAFPRDKGHYTVYLPAYSDREIIRFLEPFRDIQWQVFSKQCKQEYAHSNIRFSPVSLEGFQHSFINCTGILCNAGFETPAEAIYMGKKLCVIPMKNQYEQACNAAMLAGMGITVAYKSSDLPNTLRRWTNDSSVIRVRYPDQTDEILRRILAERPVLKSTQVISRETVLIRTMSWLAASIPESSRLHQRPL